MVEILHEFEAEFNQIEGRFSDLNARFSSFNQAIGSDMRSLKTEMWNGEQRVETRLNAKVATVESSVNFFDDKVMQKFETIEDSIGLLSDSVRAVFFRRKWRQPDCYRGSFAESAATGYRHGVVIGSDKSWWCWVQCSRWLYSAAGANISVSFGCGWDNAGIEGTCW